MLYNLPATAMDEPEGYSPEAMGGSWSPGTAPRPAINANRDPAALADTNIVLVLGESVTDPTILAGVEPSEDPLPFLRELMSRNTSGDLLVSGYGGGTANVEFEALTGLAAAFTGPRCTARSDNRVAGGAGRSGSTSAASGTATRRSPSWLRTSMHSRERTIVLFYGDHNVPIWPQAVLDANPPQAQFTTPWVVFANFDTFEVDPAATISPNLLVNQLLTAAGAPVTPLDALLTEVQQEVPALQTSMVLDPTGRVAETEDQLSPRARELLADYRLVQYDLTVGEGYAADALYAIPPRP